MKWQVVGSDGWRSVKYTDRALAVRCVENANTAKKDCTHRIVRLIGKREALRKKLTVERLKCRMLELELRVTGDLEGKAFYNGMAYALEGVLKQL
jgi:hypothetical protein